VATRVSVGKVRHILVPCIVSHLLLLVSLQEPILKLVQIIGLRIVFAKVSMRLRVVSAWSLVPYLIILLVFVRVFR